ncbi:MAG: DUF1592 domain-containing protein [Polyangiaceae bacterium]
MRRLAPLGLALWLGACQGVISDPGGTESGGGGGGSTQVTKDSLLPTPRVARLTHTQWENTVADLFGLDTPTGRSASFPKDPTQAGYLFENDATALSVDGAIWGAYQRAATELADEVVKDVGIMGRILPPAVGDDDARARAFIEAFGLRAYRRPLTTSEIDELFALYKQATPSAGLDAFSAGIRMLLSAFLQSPLFLYRVESSTAKKGGAVPLNSYEVASRLSFMLWNSMPDDELFADAKSAKLTTADGVEQAARRLLKSPRARDVIVDFHQTVLEVDKFSVIKPQAAFFPNAPADLPTLAEQENTRFLQFLLEGGGSYRDLLTSNVTFVNDDLAQIYGLSGNFDGTFTQVTLPASERRGVFTQVGFLATNAGSKDPDPIHRGAYLARRINCINVSAPPGNIPPLPASDGRSNRQTVEDHTEQPGSDCANCHSVYINPFGFPFEMYDAIGAVRTDDNGHPIDTATEPLIDGENRAVADAVDLAQQMAESTSVHECYAKYWVEYSFNRKSLPQDEGIVRHLGSLSKDGLTIEDVVVTLVRTKAFLNRSTEEMP